MKTIIIPDVHGRTFWKEAVKDNENEKIIFLGDYLDPYEHENIGKNETINNFKEIIEFKKNHMDNVILLLGNHDWFYITTKMGYCRTDFKNYTEIKTLFNVNINLFQMGYAENMNGKQYLFTHAPITKKWIDITGNILSNNYIEVINTLNSWLKDKKYDDLISVLNIIGYSRGGQLPVGSCVWCDICELDEDDIDEGTYYIFGHSQLRSEYIQDKFACLDCRKAFELHDNNELEAITEDTIVW